MDADTSASDVRSTRPERTGSLISSVPRTRRCVQHVSRCIEMDAAPNAVASPTRTTAATLRVPDAPARGPTPRALSRSLSTLQRMRITTLYQRMQAAIAEAEDHLRVNQQGTEVPNHALATAADIVNRAQFRLNHSAQGGGPLAFQVSFQGTAGSQGVTRLPPAVTFVNFGEESDARMSDALGSVWNEFAVRTHNEGVGRPAGDDQKDRSEDVWRPPIDDERVTPSMICPISQEVFRDPVIANDGHTYERKAIATWLEKHDSSPCTNQPIGSKDIRPNHAFRSLLDDLFPAHPPPPCNNDVAKPPKGGKAPKKRKHS